MTMKEAIISPDASVTIVGSPIPSPGPHQILVKVVVAGTNPKDWKFPAVTGKAHNSGDDLAGVVEAVGSEVCEFRKGDRVAGMHRFPLSHGSFAEYAILEDYLTFHIPEKTSFEEAATIPLALLTAAFGLFYVLNLTTPWQRKPENQTPLIIYGASTAVGAFAIKLAHAADIHPIIAVGSSNSSFVSEYLDSGRGDALVDYKAHATPKTLVAAIQEAALAAGVPNGRVQHAFDAVGEEGTYDKILSVAMAVSHGTKAETADHKRPRVATVETKGDYPLADPSVEVLPTYCGLAHEGSDDAVRFSAALFRMVTSGLTHGWLKAHPYEVAPSGLDGLAGVLAALKEGRVKGKKLVVRPEATESL